VCATCKKANRLPTDKCSEKTDMGSKFYNRLYKYECVSLLNACKREILVYVTDVSNAAK